MQSECSSSAVATQPHCSRHDGHGKPQREAHSGLTTDHYGSLRITTKGPPRCNSAAKKALLGLFRRIGNGVPTLGDVLSSARYGVAGGQRRRAGEHEPGDQSSRHTFFLPFHMKPSAQSQAACLCVAHGGRCTAARRRDRDLLRWLRVRDAPLSRAFTQAEASEASEHTGGKTGHGKGNGRRELQRDITARGRRGPHGRRGQRQGAIGQQPQATRPPPQEQPSERPGEQPTRAANWRKRSCFITPSCSS